MRGPSRASLADTTDQLYAEIGAGASPDQLGEEMFAVTALLDREPGLRRMLSDPAAQPRAKTGLVDELLGSRISAAALQLVRGAVSARWSLPGDLADAFEQLGVLALVESAAAGGQLDELEDELFRFGRIVNAQPQLRVTLSDPFIPADRKRALVDALLAGKVTPATLRLVTQAAVAPRGRSLDASLETYAGLAAQRRERLVAEVRTAVALSAEQRDRLRAALSTAYGHEVHLNVVLDPQVLGGMSVRIGDELIDGTIASRMAEFRRRLAA